MRLELKPVEKFSAEERDALKRLAAAVYPPEVLASAPARHVQWAPPEQGVLVWSPEGDLVSYVGIVVRAATLDDAAVQVGGIGSVKTHPRAEGRGYATAALRLAAAVLRDDHAVAFSLLVCQEHLLAFYGRLGWRRFSGPLFVTQPTGRTLFTVNRPMVLPGLRAAPEAGTLDLNGPPW